MTVAQSRGSANMSGVSSVWKGCWIWLWKCIMEVKADALKQVQRLSWHPPWWHTHTNGSDNLCELLPPPSGVGGVRNKKKDDKKKKRRRRRKTTGEMSKQTNKQTNRRKETQAHHPHLYPIISVPSPSPPQRGIVFSPHLTPSPPRPPSPGTKHTPDRLPWKRLTHTHALVSLFSGSLYLAAVGNASILALSLPH